MMPLAALDFIRTWIEHRQCIHQIHADALETITWEKSACRTIEVIRIDDNPRHQFLLKSLTPTSLPRQIENEVAAIKYIKARTSGIPTPHVLGFSTKGGDGWIALQKSDGLRLSDHWETLVVEQKWEMMQRLVCMYKLISAITAVGTKQIGGFNLDMSIGESVDAGKGSGRQTLDAYNKGPYENTQAYLRSYIDKEILYYTTNESIDMEQFDYDEISDAESDDFSDCSSDLDTAASSIEIGLDLEKANRPSVPSYFARGRSESDVSDDYVHIPSVAQQEQRQKNLDNFIAYLQDLRTTAVQLVDIHEIPCLTHNDFHAQNIMVNEDLEIVMIYNWEMAGFYPLSLTYEEPDMIDSSDHDNKDVKRFEESIEWREAFSSLFGSIKDPHPLVASCLEPMNPIMAGAWE